jgi:uncharacterized protein
MNTTKGYALVTGASKGIGKAIAWELAARGWPLLLTARSANLLQQMQAEIQSRHQIPVEVMAADLCKPEAPERIAEHCRKQGLRIQILVNNAGFGVWESFEKASFQEMEEMNALNVAALLRMCRVFIPDLRQNQQSWILNVASMGAFQPLPFMAMYGAGKAYVRSFTFALRDELRNSPISVTCLSPGGVYSEFAVRAGSTPVVEKNKTFMMTADKCARIALKAMFRKKAESIPGWYNQLGVWFTRRIPTTWSARAARRIMHKAD